MKKKLFMQEKESQPSVGGNTASVDKLIETQANILVQQYRTACFDVKQLQRILQVGETNVYQLLRSGRLPCRTVGRRKIVAAVVLAQFLVTGGEKTP